MPAITGAICLTCYEELEFVPDWPTGWKHALGADHAGDPIDVAIHGRKSLSRFDYLKRLALTRGGEFAKDDVAEMEMRRNDYRRHARLSQQFRRGSAAYYGGILAIARRFEAVEYDRIIRSSKALLLSSAAEDRAQAEALELAAAAVKPSMRMAWVSRAGLGLLVVLLPLGWYWLTNGHEELGLIVITVPSLIVWVIVRSRQWFAQENERRFDDPQEWLSSARLQ